MNRVRLGVAAIGLVLLVGGFVWGATGLHHFGHYDFRYGAIVSKDAVADRAGTNSVVTIAFDYRGFDTLGEEFILFVSVSGVALLLREMRDEREQDQVTPGIEEHGFAGASDGLKLISLVLIPLLVAFGAYLVFHGQLTPGGGFQGGVILAAGPLSVFLAGRYLRMKAIAPQTLVEAGEAIGAAGYGLVGLGGLIFAGIFFKNFLPLGTPGHLLSAGQMPIASVAVGLEVAGAFLVVWTEFLDQAMLIKGGERA